MNSMKSIIRSIIRSRLGLGMVCAGAFVGALALASVSQSAPWLAPAADEHISAGWVKEVARQLDRDRNQRILMNAPFGRPQATIIGYLNDAAVALEDDRTGYARDLVRRALGVLDDGVEFGWLTPSQVKPIKRMIVTTFNRAAQGDTKHFGDQDYDAAYGARGDRWTGYTKNRPLGLTERLDVDRRSRQGTEYDDDLEAYEGRSGHRDRQRDMRSDARDMRSGDMRRSGERGGTSRYYTDEFYYSDEQNRPSSRSGDRYREDTDPRIMRDRALHERGRERFYDESRATYDGEQTREDRG